MKLLTPKNTIFAIIMAALLMTNYMAGAVTLDGINDIITAKQIGGVIYADQYPTIQDAINATDSDNDGLAEFELYIPVGIYNISTLTTRQTVKDVLVLGSTHAISNLKIRGAGKNRTILRYVPTNPANAATDDATFLKSWYEPADVPNIDGSQFDITISDMTFDANGYLGYGLVLQYVKRYNIENVGFINFTKINPTGYLFMMGIYGNMGTARNIYISQPNITNTAWAGITELLAAGILYDSINSYDNILDNVYCIGDTALASPLKSCITLEDDAHNLTVRNVFASNINGTAITSAGANSKQSDVSFYNIHTRNIKRVIVIAPGYVNGNIQNVFAENIKGIGESIDSPIIILGSDYTISNIHINNSINPLVLLGGGIDIRQNAANNRYSGQNNIISNVFLYSLNLSRGAITIADGASNNSVMSGQIDNIIGGYGVYVWDIGGTAGTNNFVTNLKILKTAQPIIIRPNNTAINNYGTAPYNFGNAAAAPTGFGNGDTYFDTDLAEICVYSTSWKKVSDMTTACT